MSLQHIEISPVVQSLLRHGVITRDQLKSPGLEAATKNNNLEDALIEAKLVSPDVMALALAEQAGCQALNLNGLMISQDMWGIAPWELWARLNAAPVNVMSGMVVVAISDIYAFDTADQIARATGRKVKTVIATRTAIAALLSKGGTVVGQANASAHMENVMSGDSGIEMASASEKDESLDATLETAEQAPVIKMVNVMMLEALRTNASDIHFEALEKASRLRYRIDGVLIERPAPPKALHNAIVSRIKILSDLDIAERRVPQDGRFKVKAMGKEVDIRVSILPTIHGEKVVMRTLDKTNLAPSLAALGLDDFAYNAMKYAIDQPHGIILVTGPTGSGKTTTLYSCLQDLNTPDVNIVTAEDPVEYQLPGVNQVHVNAQAGLTFASVLRSVLRQDPDICLVGEIRDGETADIAVKAALTGHLVLSTLHTNDAAGVIARLIDMKVAPFMIATALILAQAQRLFRKVCPFCKEPAEPDLELLKLNDIDPAIFDGKQIFGPHKGGCDKCNHTGFKGRGAIMEVLPMTSAIRDLVMHEATSSQIRDAAVKEGMITLKNAGMIKVLKGMASIPSILEVTGGD